MKTIWNKVNVYNEASSFRVFYQNFSKKVIVFFFFLILFKASLCRDYNMLGVYIKYVDYDDVHGLCHCFNDEGTFNFPGLDAIVAGSYKENQSHYVCGSFGDRIK